MTIRSSFKPAWWLRNAHLQTVYPALLRRESISHSLQRERLPTPDGDFVDIDWCGEGPGALVMLLHGLTGSSRSGYIQGLQKALWHQGIRSVALNFRGCSGEPNRLARGYHSGDTGDIDFVYRTVRRREPDTKLAAVGFSLGGNALLKWLGERGAKLNLSAAAAICVPLQLDICATTMDRGVSRIYRDRLIRDLKAYIHDKHQYLIRAGNIREAEKIARLGDLSKIRSFWQYDDQVVAALHGFNSATHYYRVSSSRQYLKNIAIPTLLIQDLDDPFMTPEVLPGNDEMSACIRLETTQGGGHVGFVCGHNPCKPDYWLERRIPEFLYQQGVR
ncbi:hydrolase [Methylomarinum sp. Ch1-1]|uniref:Hydrolase n=1 Tax=Methylomarinum roseum TaxID=3067653 RepID=A0AAU7NYX4_9GAMM|nr:hydrolase [Methylomarinum sp. Ch1-1]MDP4521702.1 hydrolase [Methylomarinum sp. Ch1-1]